MIVSGAGGGTSQGSLGKYYHLEKFSHELIKLGQECKLVKEADYVVGFPTKKVLRFLASNKKFKNLINEFKPDIVFTDSKTDFGRKVIELRIPLFILLRGNHWAQVESAKKTIHKDVITKNIVDMRNKVAENVMSDATMLLPICNYLTNIVKQYHPNQKTSVFVEGVDSSVWYEKYGMKLKHPCVGLLQDANIWIKTEEMLLLKKVLMEYSNIHIYWAGDGIYKKNILDVLEKFENFHWLGPLQYPGKVREFLTEIDVYALISGIDMAPLTLKEAQLMQKPVIATNVGGIPEMMQDGETGYLIKKGDSNDLIKKLLILLENKELSKQMGQSGREFIENQFSLEASGKNFLNILSSYLDRL